MNSLVVFEAAARTGSFVGAARSLGVTPAAVTRQIDRLESFLGAQLFQPQGRGRSLTAVGRELFEATTSGLELIAGVTERIRQHKAIPSLTIASPLAFTSLWLISRIVSFREAHPGIVLRFETADMDLDPAQHGMGLAIRFGRGVWPNLRVSPIMRPHVFPVCSPHYLEMHGPIRSVEDLGGLTLLDREPDERSQFSIHWSRWFSEAGKPPSRQPQRISFSSYEVVIRAALASQGVALGVDILVQDLLEQNLLVRPFEADVYWREGYYLVSPRNEPTTYPMKLFREWLINEFQACGIATENTTL